MTQDEKQAVVDAEHLRLLALSHYIFGGLGVAFSLLGVLWTAVMATMFSSFPPTPEGISEEPARQVRAMPSYGTLLSAFTFVVLERASVEELYRDTQQQAVT